MAWVKFETNEQAAGQHAASVPNPDDKPIKDVRSLRGVLGMETPRESIKPLRATYGEGFVTMIFDRSFEGEVAL